MIYSENDRIILRHFNSQ